MTRSAVGAMELEKSSDHRYRADGFSPRSVKDYDDMKIFKRSGTAQYRALLKIEDPYQYRRRLTLPKFPIHSAGDQYEPFAGRLGGAAEPRRLLS
jgi:PhoPQ-activated pathogenicity-related protein